MKNWNSMSRREFLKLSSATALGLGLAGCGTEVINPMNMEIATAIPPTLSETPTCTLTETSTITPTSTDTPVPSQTPTSTPDITTLRGLADLLGMEIGTTFRPLDQSIKIVPTQFNLAIVSYHWNNREPSEGLFQRKYFDDLVQKAKTAKMSMRLNHILFRELYPDWINEISNRNKMIEIIRKQVNDLISIYGRAGVRDFNVVNEPFPENNRPMTVLGESYIDIAFEEAVLAREAVRTRRMGSGYPDPGIRLGFSNAENHFTTGYGTRDTHKYVKRLVEKGFIDYLDVHFHIKKYYDLPNPEDVIRTLQSYFDYGIDVIVGELDVNIHGMPGTKEERFAKQAEIYRTYFNAILEAGVKSITFWDTVDNESWYELGEFNGINQVDADPCLFDDNLEPKTAYFAILEILKQKAGV